MSPERQALLESLLVERFTPYRPEPSGPPPRVTSREADQHRHDLEPRLRLVHTTREESA